MVTNLNLSDGCGCYKTFRREVLQAPDLHEGRFGFDQVVTIKIAQAGWRVYETPISYDGRTYVEGRNTAWRDAAHALWCILRYGLLARSSKTLQARAAPGPLDPRS